MTDFITKLRELEARATPGEWFTLDPPWLDSGETAILLGSPDPHAATYLCDFDMPFLNEDQKGENQMEDAALIVHLRNNVPAILALAEEVERMRELVNTPEVIDFTRGVELEAAHQRERWGSAHDAGKTAFDWFWLIGYLAQKAAQASVANDTYKAKHHTISTAAALANWHLSLSGADTTMRPGIIPPTALRGQKGGEG